jgi:RNA 3'-terminal phosphate cyclase-like protein
VTHECPLSRSLGYFLEPIIMIAPFSKKPLNLTLKGITTDDKDLSVSGEVCTRKKIPSHFVSYQVDLIRTVTLPHLQLFDISEGLELRVRISSLCSFNQVHPLFR